MAALWTRIAHRHMLVLLVNPLFQRTSQEFEQMGEMTKQAVSSVEVKFADLLSKVER